MKRITPRKTLYRASLFVATVAIAVIWVGTLRAAPGDVLLMIPNPEPGQADYFGGALTALGRDIVVGCRADNPGGIVDAGTVYVFDGGTGNLRMTISNPDPHENDFFGCSVAAVGNNLLVGASGAGNGGMAYLFNGSTGQMMLTVPNPSPTGNDLFGCSVAALGDDLLVGAYWHDAGGISQAGSAYLFDGSTGDLRLAVPNPAPYSNDNFGCAVAGVGDRIFVGALRDDPGGVSSAGTVSIFDRTSATPQQVLPPPAPILPNRSFGRSLGVMSGGVAVGANDHAYVLDAVTGTVLLDVRNPDEDNSDNFGNSVAGVEGNLLVGAPNDDVVSTNAGSVFLFHGTTGELLLRIGNPAPSSNDGFGVVVASVGPNILASAMSRDVSGVWDAGAVYLIRGVPEPSTLVLAVFGLLGLVLRSRHRER